MIPTHHKGIGGMVIAAKGSKAKICTPSTKSLMKSQFIAAITQAKGIKMYDMVRALEEASMQSGTIGRKTMLVIREIKEKLPK